MSAAIPGVTDAVMQSESNGLIVPAGDVGALGAALARLWSNEALRRALGERARATIAERFAMTTVADRYFRLYMNLLDRSAHAGS
ncbi:MAG: hypothetical protein HY047_18660 [Acidobacteria bacterium]|nr:hypothetical protein [Acidobacteriota bacterium]